MVIPPYQLHSPVATTGDFLLQGNPTVQCTHCALVPEPVERKIEKKPKQLEKRWKRKLMDSKVKNEKNLECALSFVEGSETLDNIVLTADVRQTACYIHL